MKKSATIHDPDKLEEEICRLERKVNNIGQTLNDNLGHFRNNYAALLMRSIFHKRKRREGEKNGFFDSILRNDTFSIAVNRVTDYILRRTAEGIDVLFEKVFHKKK